MFDAAGTAITAPRPLTGQYTSREALAGEAEAIQALLVSSSTGPPGQFAVDEAAFIERVALNPDEGFVRVVEDASGEVVATMIVWLPGDDPESLAFELGLPPAECAHMETVAVRPGSRGHRLQVHLLAEAEERLTQSGVRYALATVAPDNIASLRSFQRRGFTATKRITRYGGHPRIVLAKTLS